MKILCGESRMIKHCIIFYVTLKRNFYNINKDEKEYV